MENYTRINKARFSSNVNKTIINCSYLDDCEKYFILGGIDLKLFDLKLNLVDEQVRKTKDNSIKFMTLIKNDKLALATNSDVEIYALVCLTASLLPASASASSKRINKCEEDIYPN